MLLYVDMRATLNGLPDLLSMYLLFLFFQYCQTMQKQIILEILSELYNFLSLEAGEWLMLLCYKWTVWSASNFHVLVSEFELTDYIQLYYSALLISICNAG